VQSGALSALHSRKSMRSLGFGTSLALLWASVLTLVHLTTCAPVSGHNVVGIKANHQRHIHLLSNNEPKVQSPILMPIPVAVAAAAGTGPRHPSAPPSTMGVVDTSEPTQPFPHFHRHSFQPTRKHQSLSTDSNSNPLDVSSSSTWVAKALPYLFGPNNAKYISSLERPVDDDPNPDASSFPGGHLFNNLFNLQLRQGPTRTILPSYYIPFNKILQKLKGSSSPTKKNKKTAKSLSGAISGSPIGPMGLRRRSGSSPLPPAGWRRGIYSAAPASQSAAARIAEVLGVSEKTTEGVMFEIFGMTNPSVSGILGKVKSLAAREGKATKETDLEELKLAHQLMSDIIWST